MILHTEDPKEADRKLLELFDEFGKFLQVNNTQKYVAFLYSHNKREKFRKQFHLPLHQKELKYLGINLSKETKDLYSKKP